MAPFGNLTIRKIVSDDETFLYEMLYQAIFVPEGSEQPPRNIVYKPELSKYAHEFGRSTDMGYIAIESITQRPIGAAWLRLLTADQQGFGHVDDATPELTIAVSSDYRGLGVGTGLLKQLLSDARKHYSNVSLSVWPENPAYRLYQRLGFEVVDQRGSAVTMVKRLDSG